MKNRAPSRNVLAAVDRDSHLVTDGHCSVDDPSTRLGDSALVCAAGKCADRPLVKCQ
jgi:hypothetical protein